MTLTSWRKVYWSRASLNSFSLLAKRLMTSSTVIPFGSDLSRAPSCARATWGSMMIGSSALNNAARERSNGNVNRAGRDWNLMNLILTKREHKKINGSLHPQSRRANGLFGGGGRLQFCLFHWMRQASEGLQDLLFFTYRFLVMRRWSDGRLARPGGRDARRSTSKLASRLLTIVRSRS